MKLLCGVASFMNNEDGATAIEYSLVAAGVSAVIALTVFSIGRDMNSKFEDVENQLR